MPIITLISDFGDKDWYAGALKGALLTAAPDAALIDISHSIAPFEMVQAALVARNTWQEFPAGTIHVLAVNCVYGPDIQFLVAAHKGHFFIAPNNGVLSLLFGPEMPATLRVLPAGGEHFAVKPVVSTAAHHKLAAIHPLNCTPAFRTFNPALLLDHVLKFLVCL